MKSILIGIVFAGLVSTGALAATMVVDGSFEDTTHFVVNSGNDTMVLNPGDTALTGWNVINNQIAWIGPTNPFGITASDGQYSLDLQSYSDSGTYGGVTQSLATVIGGQYLLTFDLGTYFGGDALTASAGTGSHLFTAPSRASFGWDPESLSFTATSTSTLLTLLGTTNANDYIGLDKVAVTCTASCSVVTSVPEPATWALFLLGIGGIGFMMRARHKRGSAEV
jgi:hypothetical protein